MITIQELHTVFLNSKGVSIDSRKVFSDQIFFALKGPNFNGSDYAFDAFSNGAKYVVTDEPSLKEVSNVLFVNDVLQSLQDLSCYHRQFLDIPIIALTGSNGKTTTKELISSLLSKSFNVVSTKGNLNNHIGVPLTLLSMDKNTQLGVVEMGANHLNEISFLSSMCKPNYGYITNFGKAHLEGFGSIEGVVKGKSELYDYLKRNNQFIFVNKEDQKQVELTNDYENVLYTSSRLELTDSFPTLQFIYKGNSIRSNLIGDYNFYNLQSAVTIAEFFKIEIKDIIDVIESYSSDNNRSQLAEFNNTKVILDAYNANPTSMKTSIDSFCKMNYKRKGVVLGDMMELGKYSGQEHQEIVDYLETLNFDFVVLYGDIFQKTVCNFKKFTDYNSLKIFFDSKVLEVDLLLIKGSRSMALERLVKGS